MQKPTPGGPRERRLKEFASKLSLLKHEAGTLGLYVTMQRMDYPLQMVGWEIAGDIEGCERFEKTRLKAK
jgi:hypothetical protein